jgi:hypothetical protein
MLASLNANIPVIVLPNATFKNEEASKTWATRSDIETCPQRPGTNTGHLATLLLPSFLLINRGSLGLIDNHDALRRHSVNLLLTEQPEASIESEGLSLERNP